MANRNRQRRRQQQPPAPVPHQPDFWGRLREYRWTILRVLPLGVLLPVTLFLGSVGPDDFAKNYASWARTWGLTDWAEWLSLYATGPRVFWGAALVSSVYIAIAFIVPFLIRRASKDSAVVAVPMIVSIIVIVAVFGQYEMAISGERHVSEYQRAKLKESLSPVAANFPRALLVAAIDTPEAQGFAAELMTGLALAGIKIATLDRHGTTMAPTIMRAIGQVKGIFFQVKDPKNPPAEVATLKKALESASMHVHFMPNVDFPDSDYVLTVGLP
jgi:hypothetical protein